jgi:Chaperone of endosialidase
LTTAGTAAAVRGVAANGIGTNGISTSGVGQQGLSDSGIGTLGTHGNTTGVSPGVQGETNSTDPTGAGVVGKNNGGGPGLRAIVNPGAPPLAVNSQVKVTNLNADKLDDLDSAALQKRVSGTCGAGSAVKSVNADGTVVCEPVGGGGVWSLTGNSGTTPGTNFLGTSDNTAFELKVNAQRALRIEPDATSPNLIGGFSGNSVAATHLGSVVSGGGASGAANHVETDYDFIGAGLANQAGTSGGGGASAVVAGTGNVASGGSAIIGAGANNLASANYAAIGAGQSNTASGVRSAVGAGQSNTASGGESVVTGGFSNTASGSVSVVAGGQGNTATGFGSAVAGGVGNTASGGESVVTGGAGNTAGGDFSFAAGTQAKATQNGSFVWGDETFSDLTSPAVNTFTVRASGGIWLGTTSSPAITAGHFIDTSTGAYLSSAGAWTNSSDRAKKHDFRRLSTKRVLAKVARMPITSWSYRAEKPSVRHIGPMAQDFYKAFGLGLDNKHITTIDEGGVALAAIQGLYRDNRDLHRQNDQVHRENLKLKGTNAGLSRRLDRLEQSMARLENELKASHQASAGRER